MRRYIQDIMCLTSRMLHRFLNLDWLGHKWHQENLWQNKPDENDLNLSNKIFLEWFNYETVNFTSRNMTEFIPMSSNWSHFAFVSLQNKIIYLISCENYNILVVPTVNSLLYTSCSDFSLFVFPMLPVKKESIKILNSIRKHILGLFLNNRFRTYVHRKI